MAVEIRQHMADPKKLVIPKIRGTQLGLSNPGQIDQIKADMLAGRFDYAASPIAGVQFNGVYYVKIGHHRMVAALEIYKETGDPFAILELLKWGLFPEVPNAPNDGRPMPSRNWWRALRNWLGI
jgi:hypothetical protein